jgi:ABC-type branched-subunit amino acid transport system substrate-binding protein
MRISLLFVALLLAGCSRSDTIMPIELGHLDPGDHDDAEFKAINLVVEELNKDETKLPLGRKIRLLHAPGGTKSEEWGAQATRFIAMNKVKGLIGGQRFDQAERIGAAVQGESVIAMSLAGWAGSSPSPNLFTIGIAPSERGRVLAKAALERKPKTILIVRDPMAKTANVAADQFAADCKAAGVRVTDIDIAAERPVTDAVFFACPVRQAIESRPDGDSPCLFGGDDTEIPILFAGGVRADGLLVATAFHPDLKTDQLTAFTARYREKYTHAPSTAAILAYDAFSIWVDAVRRANSLEVGPVREQLLKRDQPFDTLTGPLHFADDHSARRPIFVSRVSDAMLKDTRAYDVAPIK